MGRKVPPGLAQRGKIWWIQKTVGDQRIRKSTGSGDLVEAEKYLHHLIEEHRKASVYGIRPDRSFREAATRYLKESTKSSLPREALVIEELVARFIGDLPLRSIHVGRLQPFIAARRAKGNKNRTINYGLQVVRHILNLAANEWIDEHGLTWLEHAPKIRLLREDDKREPYPLSWDEQERLFSFLPQHLRQMALFTVNTGSRDQEVCNLRWEWEIDVPALNTSVFIVPKHRVKNREDRLVVLNRVAKALIEEVRGIHSDYVFSYRGKRLQRMRSHGWLTACAQAGLSHVRVHDLKHTFGRRLRAAGVSFEDRQVYRPVENRGGWRLKSAAPMS